MKPIILLLISFFILWFIELSMSVLEKIFLTGRKIIQIIKVLLLFLFLVFVITYPHEFGQLLHPILGHFSPIVDLFLELIGRLILLLIELISAS
jgi:hypothetical protein